MTAHRLRDGKPTIEFLSILPPKPVIVEVGANDGENTAGFLQICPDAKITAFEPDPRAAAKFRARQFPANVTLMDCAIGDRNGDVTFHQSSGRPPDLGNDWDASGSIRKPSSRMLDELPWMKFDQTITVPILRLDDALQGMALTAIDLLWVDIQGAEADLIRGAPNTLAMTRYAYLEYSEREDYEGQANLKTLTSMLPDFSVEEIMQYDVLYKSRLPAMKRTPTVTNRMYMLREALARGPAGAIVRRAKQGVRSITKSS